MTSGPTETIASMPYCGGHLELRRGTPAAVPYGDTSEASRPEVTVRFLGDPDDSIAAVEDLRSLPNTDQRVDSISHDPATFALIWAHLCDLGRTIVIPDLYRSILPAPEEHLPRIEGHTLRFTTVTPSAPPAIRPDEAVWTVTHISVDLPSLTQTIEEQTVG